MAIAHVQSVFSASTTDGQTLAYGSAITAGSLLVVAIKAGTLCTTAVVSDTLTNTWAKAGAAGAAAASTLVYYAMNSPAGANSVTVTTSTTSARVSIHEYSGLALTDALDKLGVAEGTAVEVIDTSSIATTVADELLFCAVGITQNVTGETAGAGYTVRGKAASRLVVEDRIVAATGTYTNGMSWTTAGNCGAVLASFKAASGVSVPVGTNLHRRFWA